jgi:hypothetical protein
MASSSDPGGEGTWVRPEDITYLPPGSAAANNEQVQVIKKDHPQNLQGHDILLYLNPQEVGETRSAFVTLHNGHSHKVRLVHKDIPVPVVG